MVADVAASDRAQILDTDRALTVGAGELCDEAADAVRRARDSVLIAQRIVEAARTLRDQRRRLYTGDLPGPATAIQPG